VLDIKDIQNILWHGASSPLPFIQYSMEEAKGEVKYSAAIQGSNTHFPFQNPYFSAKTT